MFVTVVNSGWENACFKHRCTSAELPRMVVFHKVKNT